MAEYLNAPFDLTKFKERLHDMTCLSNSTTSVVNMLNGSDDFLQTIKLKYSEPPVSENIERIKLKYGTVEMADYESAYLKIRAKYLPA